MTKEQLLSSLDAIRRKIENPALVLEVRYRDGGWRKASFVGTPESVGNLSLNCSMEYRIRPGKKLRPEKKLRPWTPEELITRMAERPLLVRRKGGQTVLAVLGWADSELGVIVCNDGLWLLAGLLNRWEQHDGSPCGVLE